jgi:hypothetical protein
MKITRRSFSAGFMAPLAREARPQTPARQRALKRFREISASLYAWDLLDEGVEGILDTLAETALINSTYLVALMHHEKRPLTDFFYPHNPKRKTYYPEDSRAYWRPRPEHYRETKIKPLTSGRDELKGTDWLETLIAASRRRKWKTGAEVSHTVLDAERARGEHADTVQRDIWGNPIGQLICPNNPHARSYLTGLFTDLVKNYDIDYVQTCLVPFAQGRSGISLGLGGEAHQPGSFGYQTWGGRGGDLREAVLNTTLGGCFCPSCAAAAKGEGLDLASIRKGILPVADTLDHPDPAGIHHLAKLRASNISPAMVLIRHPEIFEWLEFRCRSITRLFADVQAAIRAIRPSIDLRLNAYIYDNPELAGIDFAALAPHLGSIRSSNYDEQSGRMERLEHKRQFLLSVRTLVGDQMYFLSAIGVRPDATPELIRRGVLISSECGADGLTLGHYDGAPLRNLEAIGDGLREADVTVG